MAIPVSLGMPAAPPPVLAPRRQTRQLDVGGVGVGSDFPVSVQSMTTTKTADINATLQQIAELTAAGCQIVRVAVPDTDDAEALPAIARKSQIPVIADIHFQPRYVFAAIDAGCAAVRVNPGNIKKFDDKVGEIAKAAKDAGIPIRIGVNAGSLDKRLLAKYGKATPGGAGRVGALGVLAVRGARLPRHQDLGQAQRPGGHGRAPTSCSPRSATTRCTSASPRPARRSRARSSPPSPSARCCPQGIGDTIRVSLSAPPVEEVKVGNQILESLNLRQRGLEIVSCPSCGRAQVDVYKLAEEVTAGLEGMEVPLRVAVMGCVVNGPGEAREADLGVASGNGKGQIFVRGEVIKTVPESQIVETLIEEAMRIAARAGRRRRRRPGRPSSASADPTPGQRPAVLPNADRPRPRRARRGRRPPAAGHRSGRRLRPGRPGRGRPARAAAALGAPLWGFGAAGRAGGGVPRRREPDPVRRPGRRARRRRGLRRAGPPRRPPLLDDRRPGRRRSRRCGSCSRPHWGPARDHRPRQPLMAIDGPPAVARRAAGAPGPARRARRRCCPAAVAMFTEEVGRQPAARRRRRRLPGPGGRAGARRAVAGLDRGRRRCVFKAEIGAVSRAACQVQGVWVGPGAPRPRASARPARPPSSSTPAPTIAPVVSLYVNDFNTAGPGRLPRGSASARSGRFASVLF